MPPRRIPLPLGLSLYRSGFDLYSCLSGILLTSNQRIPTSPQLPNGVNASIWIRFSCFLPSPKMPLMEFESGNSVPPSPHWNPQLQLPPIGPSVATSIRRIGWAIYEMGTLCCITSREMYWGVLVLSPADCQSPRGRWPRCASAVLRPRPSKDLSCSRRSGTRGQARPTVWMSGIHDED